MSLFTNRALLVRILRVGAVGALAVPALYLLALVALITRSFGGPGGLGPIEWVVGFAVPFTFATLGAVVVAALLSGVALLLEDGEATRPEAPSSI